MIFHTVFFSANLAVFFSANLRVFFFLLLILVDFFSAKFGSVFFFW